jgi:hypothetical protein
MNKRAIIVLLIIAIVAIAGCTSQGNGSTGKAVKPYTIEEISNQSYLITAIEDSGYSNADALKLGYIKVDTNCNIRYTTEFVEGVRGFYNPTETTELIIKVNSCVDKPN